eukprot:UN16282
MYRLNGFSTFREVEEFQREQKKQKDRLRHFPLSIYNSQHNMGTSTRRKRKGVHLIREEAAKSLGPFNTNNR